MHPSLYICTHTRAHIHTHTHTHVHTYIHMHTHRLLNGAEYLFVAKDEVDVISWVSAIKSAIQPGPPMNTLSLTVGSGKKT